jgi:hypothetical protein
VNKDVKDFISKKDIKECENEKKGKKEEEEKKKNRRRCWYGNVSDCDEE